MRSARVLLVDNYDSFSTNLEHALAERGACVRVVKNDRADVGAIEDWAPDALVLSPGPGNPWTLRDVGLCPALVERWWGRCAILGVCLGHQLLLQMLGGRIVRAPNVVHGKQSDVFHNGHPLLEGVPSPFAAMRYHSWAAAAALPQSARTIAWTPGVTMGFAHDTLPVYGLQFHPESIGTPAGPHIIGRFLRIALGSETECGVVRSPR